jgi:hypothetical protein
MYRVPQNHPSFFISKITPSTMIGKNSTVSNTPQIIKFPLNLFENISLSFYIYLKIRIKAIGGNFFLSFFTHPEGGEGNGSQPGLQTGNKTGC